MNIKALLSEKTKEAMKTKQKDALVVLRGFSAAIKQREIDEQIELTNEQVLSVLDKKIKQSKDSFNQFTDANRIDLAEKEQFDISILSQFLPKQLTEDEIEQIVKQAISQTSKTGMAAMGEIISTIKPQLQGKADMKVVSQLVKSKLS